MNELILVQPERLMQASGLADFKKNTPAAALGPSRRPRTANDKKFAATQRGVMANPDAVPGYCSTSAGFLWFPGFLAGGPARNGSLRVAWA